MITSEQIKQEWEENDGWYQNPKTSLWLKIGDGAEIGDGVTSTQLNELFRQNYIKQVISLLPTYSKFQSHLFV